MKNVQFTASSSPPEGRTFLYSEGLARRVNICHRFWQLASSIFGSEWRRWIIPLDCCSITAALQQLTTTSELFSLERRHPHPCPKVELSLIAKGLLDRADNVSGSVGCANLHEPMITCDRGASLSIELADEGGRLR